MADNPAFFRARAAEQYAAAKAATLANVRARCERAAHAWDEMAARAERTEAMRHAREAKAEQARMALAAS